MVSLDREGTVSPSPEKGWVVGVGVGVIVVQSLSLVGLFATPGTATLEPGRLQEEVRWLGTRQWTDFSH